MKIIAPMKIKKHFVISLWYCRKKTNSCGTRNFCRTFQETHRFFEKCINTCHNIQQIKTKSVKSNLRIRTFQGKNEDEMTNFEKMNLIFKFSISKLCYMEIFMKI